MAEREAPLCRLQPRRATDRRHGARAGPSPTSPMTRRRCSTMSAPRPRSPWAGPAAVRTPSPAPRCFLTGSAPSRRSPASRRTPRKGIDFLEGMGDENIEEFNAALEGPEALHSSSRSVAGRSAASSRPIECAKAFGDLVDDVDRGALTGAFAEWIAASFREALRESYWGWFDDDMAFIRPWGFDLDVDPDPVHVWQGRHDRMVPYSHGQWLAAHVPTAVPHLFEDEGHLSLGSHSLWRHPGCAGRLRALRASLSEDDPFTALVVAALDSLPEVFRERLGSVAIVVEDEASPGAAAVGPGARPVRPLPGRAADVVGGGPQSVCQQDHDLPGTTVARLANTGRPRPAGHRDRPSRDRPPLRDLGRAAPRASPLRPLKRPARGPSMLLARAAPEPGK